MRIAVLNAKPYEIDQFKAIDHSHELTFVSETLTKDPSQDLPQQVKGHEAVSVFVNDEVNKDNLDTLHNLGVKYLLVRAAGHNNIDLDHARKLGIRVANVPHYSPHAVAEFVLTLILALCRNLIRATHKISQHIFTFDDLIGTEIHGKKVGIIGLGKIEETLAEILTGFGCTILGFDVEEKKELTDRGLLHQTDIDSLFKQ